jgi:adenine-specific DNA-methyltransferase
LKKFRAILSDRREVENGIIKYFQLQWPRTEAIFTGEKIVVPYRSETNTFAYDSGEWFCRSDCYVITQMNATYDLKYLLALLNSTLYFKWLYHRGKRKGEMLELFQVPLSEIPIKPISTSEQKSFIALVDKILAITKDPEYFSNSSEQIVVGKLEERIDEMVYQLYELTPEEIDIVKCKK